jgi:hypothetical protein
VHDGCTVGEIPRCAAALSTALLQAAATLWDTHDVFVNICAICKRDGSRQQSH